MEVDFGDDPYARISPFKESGEIIIPDSPNGEELNPPPPVKVCARSISAVESRLLNLASNPAKESSRNPRRSRNDSNSENNSSDKKTDKSTKRRVSRSPRSTSRKRSRTRSPRKGDRSTGTRQGRSRSPKRKSSSQKKSSRDSSRSPKSSKRSRSRSPRKRRRSSSSTRRKRSRTPPPPRRRKSRSRSRRRGGSRSRSKDRNGGGSRRRSRRSRSRSRSRSPKVTSKWGQKPASGNPKEKEMTTEDVEKRLAQHMKSVQEKQAEEAKKINLPGYLNPAMVNVHQFKQIQDKRKLLWGKTNVGEAGKWAGAFGDGSSEDKFRRLMGINEAVIENNKGAESESVQQSRKVLDELEKEYEKSRAFQLSRGAGGVTGIGLGFASAVGAPHPHPHPQQPPAPQ